jgi:hypothetical protein
MATKVFISSVTTGLTQERTALPGLILGLGMEPLRFEEFTTAPTPSREVCLRAVGESDVYLLLLGEHYGTAFPDTGLSPTHEEYRAAIARGIPRLAFRRRGVTMDSEQTAFVAEVEAYPTGLFRGSFAEVGELLAEAGKALRELPGATGGLAFTPLRSPVEVRWRTPVNPRAQTFDAGSPGLEVYLTPVDRSFSAAQLRRAGDVLPRILREFGGVGHSVAIDVAADTNGGAVARVRRQPARRGWDDEPEGGELEGLSVGRSGEVCGWASLRRDHFGAVVDSRSLVEVLAPLVSVAGRALGEAAGAADFEVVPSVALVGAQRVNLGRSEVIGNRNRATMALTGADTLTLPGDESAALGAVVAGTRDVATDLAARVLHALETR